MPWAHLISRADHRVPQRYALNKELFFDRCIILCKRNGMHTHWVSREFIWIKGHATIDELEISSLCASANSALNSHPFGLLDHFDLFQNKTLFKSPTDISTVAPRQIKAHQAQSSPIKANQAQSRLIKASSRKLYSPTLMFRPSSQPSRLKFIPPSPASKRFPRFHFIPFQSIPHRPTI